MKKLKVICFGEVLFDNFPTHSKIGGAPLNVSLRLQSYGVDVSTISSVGDDVDGKKIIKYLNSCGVNTDGIQVSSNYGTGQVNVVLNDKGVASYDIAYPVAWDKILPINIYENQLKETDIFIYGSLACRDNTSSTTLKQLLEIAKYKVFDVNLRAPHYTKKLILELMQHANFVKFNDDELYEVAEYLGSKYNSMEQTIVFVAQQTQTETICVTKGAYGAVLYHQNIFYYNSGYRIKVLDTVGSGDSFLASVIYKLFNGEGPQAAIDFGCAVGAMVAKSEGANPIFTKQRINKFMNP
ncbi:carbohydrate kinase [Arenibacter sp. BSSL-BM3]|uniref:Carbohydrate kinase n=1 Tax=Arenibacter arenosicollis TaxID=2762274 RepID=A0ABR7QKG6_9FLAO|nr:carbohydrate kinase [Arenibacter arenosicollis]MBC8767668.1 carbohydrate kinase [Arenibacter arenosicollis]